MAEKDLQLFLQKVAQLNELVDSLNEIDGRREKLSQCCTHEEVVLLAKHWGFDIGRRWGEK